MNSSLRLPEVVTSVMKPVARNMRSQHSKDVRWVEHEDNNVIECLGHLPADSGIDRCEPLVLFQTYSVSLKP